MTEHCITKRITMRLSITALALAISASATTAQGTAIEADLIVRNARIWTGDPAQPRAQALAVRGERLIAVGTDAQVDAHRSARTRVIDAGGRFITPGFIDSHTHNVHVGEFRYRLDQLNLPAQLTPSEEDLPAAVRERAMATPPGQWIGGR